jgi:ankyrin repeat protein
VAQLLLSHKADVNIRDLAGWTPLHEAAGTHHKDIVELLLVYDTDINIATSHGWTPLHAAAGSGDKSIVDLLLANNANVNARSNTGVTPLQLALLGGVFKAPELKRELERLSWRRGTLGDYMEVEALLRQHGGRE